MKICIEGHHVPSFGTIPEGSLWDDDSPYIGDAAKFADAREDDETVPDEPAKPVTKPRTPRVTKET